MVGLSGFEPESIEPKSTSLDQASREPPQFNTEDNFICTIKTYPNNIQKTKTAHPTQTPVQQSPF